MGLLNGKSLEQIKKLFVGLTNDEIIELCLKNQKLYTLIPRNKDGRIIYKGQMWYTETD